MTLGRMKIFCLIINESFPLDSVDQLMHEPSSSPIDKSSKKRKERSESDRSKMVDEPFSGFLINEEELPTPGRSSFFLRFQCSPSRLENPEEPVKQLEDFFRKTNATPSIYWLPLTEEQVNCI